MNIIDKVLRRPELLEAPPVLIDVGASSGIHTAWKPVAEYSICVAFDADDRGMGGTQRETETYRELHVYDRALTSGTEQTADFYFTADPPCSSMLPPDTEGLSTWEFSDRFRVVRKTQVKTIHLNQVLSELKLSYVDWFKTDSQGTDLRLFLSLPDSVARRVMVAEFEPGIIDSYQGEDKLWQVMARMDEMGFWMSDLTVKGSSRIRKDLVGDFSKIEKKYMVHLLKSSPGWAEATYLNSFAKEHFNKRDFLLGWVLGTLHRQHGYAMELAASGGKQFGDGIFKELQRASLQAIRRRYFDFPAYLPLARRAFRRWKRLRMAVSTSS